MSLLRRAPQVSRIRVASSVAWIETILITIFVPLFGYWVHEDDPFFLKHDFPWLLFAPILPAMRYGFGHGFTSAIILISMIAIAWRFELAPLSRFPSGYALGLLMLTMLVGEFTDMWLRQLGKKDVINNAQRKRLDEFTRNYQLLKVSHDRLENRLASGTNSLREALVNLKLKSKSTEGQSNVLQKVSVDILTMLADYSFVQSANIYQIQSDKLINTKPLATLGNIVLVDPYNPIIRKSLETGLLVSINNEIYEEDDDPMNKSNLLAAVPVSDVDGYIWGVIAIHEMPFVAFHTENLQLISVLCGHIGDLISLAEHRYSYGDSESSIFLYFLARTISDRKNFDVETILLVLTLPDDKYLSTEAETLLLGQMRGLDRVWVQKNMHGRTVIFLLMPLTSIIEFEGYKERISQMFKERLGRTWGEIDMETSFREINGKETLENMMAELCGVTKIDWEKIKHSNRSSS
jgi:polysaccharide biosynthesis protein PelD